MLELLSNQRLLMLRIPKKKICFLDFLSWELKSTNQEESIISLEVEREGREIQGFLYSL